MDIYDRLLHHYNVTPDRRGWATVECPVCGEKRKGKAAFSEHVFHCFVCGTTWSLERLAREIGLMEGGGTPGGDFRPHSRPPRPPRREKPRRWFTDPDYWVKRALEHPQRIPAWQSYAPLTVESIARFRLGVGVVPATPCPHLRLVYPYRDEQAGGRWTLRGRIWRCGCDPKTMKWLTAGGGHASLWGREFLADLRGRPVVVCESPVDAMLVMQETGDEVVAVAGTAGASTWRDEWTRLITEAHPPHVLVVFDHDLHGNGGGSRREEFAREWFISHPRARRLPVANGPRVANLLREAGVTAWLWEWPGDAPKGADVRWLVKASSNPF